MATMVYTEKTTLLIAVQHRLVREAMRDMLEADQQYRVLGMVQHFGDVLEFVKLRRPQVVVLDLQMPPETPATLMKDLAMIAGSSRLVLISLYAIPAYLKRLLDTGISGIVTKDSPCSELITAVRAGKPYLPYLCEEARQAISAATVQQAVLTSRQKEVVRLVTEGYSSREIAKRIFVAEKTVEIHRYNILKKLKLENTVSLVNYVSMYGI